jgi:hypothetical protein
MAFLIILANYILLYYYPRGIVGPIFEENAVAHAFVTNFCALP